MKINTIIRESFNELIYKVSWPTWKELQNSAVIVMVASIIIALVIFAIDFIFEHGMRIIYSLFY
jgi:preprotein translocase subunit SecE